MKKKIVMGISVIFILTILIFTTPVKAADYAGHDFSEDYFAVEIDLYPDADNPDVIYDWETGVTGTDTYPQHDVQFYMNYMNDSGIEVAYSALEKLEYSIKLRDLLPEKAVEVLDYFSISEVVDYTDELNTDIFHINATAPFQQVVQHFNTPWGTDVFFTNNFMTLVAYTNGTGSNPTLMDSGDRLYIGYTFAVQNITDVINDLLETEGKSYRIPHFNYKASFEPTSTGYKFGINYTNMFVLWQELNVSLTSPETLAGQAPPPPKGIIYGQDIVAASVLDHLAFEYTFEVEEIDFMGIKVNLGTVETKYHIGETNFLITRNDDAAYLAAHASDFTSASDTSPFIGQPVYKLKIPEALKGLDLGDPDGPLPLPDLPAFPTVDVDVELPEMAFYIGDDAKIRMRKADGFGLTVVTSTNWCDVKISMPQYVTHLDDPNDPEIDCEDEEDNVIFFTSFKNKMHYKLRELDFAPFNIDPNKDRDVYVKLFDPTSWGWVFPPAAEAYFLLEFGLALKFTQFIATKIAPEITYPGTDVALVANILYLTFTEFPEWFGGEIYHDPAYSAVAAVVAEGETDTSGEETAGGGIPGFELLSVLIAIPPMYALYRKRR